jgi:hypothetical protein
VDDVREPASAPADFHGEDDIKDVFNQLDIGGITGCQSHVVNLAICEHAIDGKKIDATLYCQGARGDHSDHQPADHGTAVHGEDIHVAANEVVRHRPVLIVGC